jgi:hypothetical protein
MLKVEVMSINEFLAAKEVEDYVTWANKNRKRLKKLAVFLWTLSGTMLTRVGEASFYDNMKPLLLVFQEMSIGLGSFAIIIGLGLLVIKKRWGVMTLKMIAIIVLGVFLAPSALLLIAIVGTYTNDALYEAFKEIYNGKVKQ